MIAFSMLLACDPCDAKPPEIRNINIRGLQIGGTTVVAIDGADLTPASKLYLDEQPLEIAVDPTSTVNRLVLSIPVASTVIPGVAQLRIATDEGFSNTVLVGLDRFPQLPLSDEVATTQVALHGSVPGSGVSRTSFAGKAGEELIAEVEARRIGSKLRPVVHLYDSNRVQLAWAMPSNVLAGDARFSLKLPHDGKYTIEVHDSQYAPPGPSFFRLRLGQWQFADAAFPPAVQRGQDANVQLIGNVPGAQFPIRADGFDLVLLTTPFTQSFCGIPPSIAISPFPELIESGEQPMNLPGIPIAVSGRLDVAGQFDRFQFPVTAGMKIVAEVFAERIGSRADALMEFRNKQGAVLATVDDSPNTTDPTLEFTIPANTDMLEIAIRDQLQNRSDDAVYRLVISDTAQPQPGFEVLLKGDVVNSPEGETPVIEAFVTRKNYDGPIELIPEQIPSGMQLIGTVIPAGANGTLLGLQNATGPASPLVTRFIARSPDGAVVRRVRVEPATDDKTPLCTRERIGLTASAKKPPFQLVYANETAVTQFLMVSKQSVPVRMVRPPSTFGPVRLSLVVSQPQPKLNGQPNPNLSIRAERPVEVAVDPNVLNAGNALAALAKQLDEATKLAQAAQGDAKVAADARVIELGGQRDAAEAALRDVESKTVYTVDFPIIVPSSVGQSSCDLSLRAELLNVERNQVQRTVYLPIKRLAVVNPLIVKVDGPSMLETTFDAATGASVTLMGKIERLPNYPGLVNVRLQGLPAGVTVELPKIANASIRTDATGTTFVVSAEAADFSAVIKFPANYAGPDSFSIKLSGTGPADPLSGNVPVTSDEVAVMLKVNRPAK